ncbi:MAG: hypothetical protein IKA71_05945 [Lentisphaeria bacterium]|nr:hypothetical protein [Lentisphaeria bacterium]
MRNFLQLVLKLYRAETDCGRWIKFTVSLTLGVILGAALLAFIVDPHYRYREPFFYDTVYYEIYATAPHILKHQQYDLLMLGTSMTRNFFLEDINKAFDCDAVKLAASGGTPGDLRKFFEVAKAARGEKLRRVILSLDIYPLNKDYTRFEEFSYMYRDDHREDYRYLFSRKTFSNMIYLIKRKQRPKRHRRHQSDRNRMFATEYDGKPYGFNPVISDVVHNVMINHRQTAYNAEAYRKNLNVEILPMFDENPDIRFIVYLPPYHIYTYCQSEAAGEADALIKQRTEVMLELLKRPNVELHDFQSDGKYVLDFDKFSDTQHFSNTAAREILADLRSSRRRIRTAADVLANEAELRLLMQRKMKSYHRDLNKFNPMKGKK